ncbi:MAG: response regulator [Deltaproteobacteria bacterium]|nr:response regulator [Deltaproteobacteria bacterium]
MDQDKIRLLIVDDEVRFLETLSQRLVMRDFDVSPVSSGDEAVKLAREKEFDIALVDLKMPGMSGEEVLRTLKKEHPLVEVVILTGHGSIDSAVQCVKEGSYQYLQKPCETDELMEVLKEAFKVRVKRKLEIDGEKLEQLMGTVYGESALSILRKLKDLDRKGG